MAESREERLTGLNKHCYQTITKPKRLMKFMAHEWTVAVFACDNDNDLSH